MLYIYIYIYIFIYEGGGQPGKSDARVRASRREGWGCPPSAASASRPPEFFQMLILLLLSSTLAFCLYLSFFKYCFTARRPPESEAERASSPWSG